MLAEIVFLSHTEILSSLQWLGFGPEQLSIPSDFQIPVSSFGQYGGHASICVRYDNQARAPLYRIGDAAPGDNIAYLQGKTFLSLIFLGEVQSANTFFLVSRVFFFTIIQLEFLATVFRKW